MRDVLRLAFGTLTALPVAAPGRVDRRTAGRAMSLAPAVGLALGLPVVALWWALGSGVPSLLGATLAIALLALLTRGLHLDGLADTADGLGSAKPSGPALALMRQGDVGPFGVVTLVLVLLVQVAALAQLLATGAAWVALPVALVVSRLSLPAACTRGIPGARLDGLGSAVAGSVTPALAALAALVSLTVLGVVLGVALVAGARDPDPVLLVAMLVLPLLAAAGLVHRCVHRLGGITGDVLGAGVEISFTTCLVAACLGGGPA